MAITARQRQKLPSSDFALPGKGTGRGGKGPGSYPIDTAARARNALARGAQNASPTEQATIKRKVRAKYPGIAVAGGKAGNSNGKAGNSSGNRGTNNRIAGELSRRLDQRTQKRR